MAIDNTNDWVPASSMLTELVKEGRKLTWRKPYNDTKIKDVSSVFNYTANIYEIRMSREFICETRKCEYMEIRTLGNYKLPGNLDDLCSDLFDLSLAYNLVAVDAEYLEIVVEKSKDGSTNIDGEVMEAMMDIQNKVAKQLHKIRS